MGRRPARSESQRAGERCQSQAKRASEAHATLQSRRGSAFVGAGRRAARPSTAPRGAKPPRGAKARRPPQRRPQRKSAAAAGPPRDADPDMFKTVGAHPATSPWICIGAAKRVRRPGPPSLREQEAQATWQAARAPTAERSEDNRGEEADVVRASGALRQVIGLRKRLIAYRVWV